MESCQITLSCYSHFTSSSDHFPKLFKNTFSGNIVLPQWRYKQICSFFPVYIEIISYFSLYKKIFTLKFGASLLAQMVKNLPAVQKNQIQSLAWGDLLQKGMATRFTILARRIPCTEETGRLQSTGSQIVGQDSNLHSLLP